MPTFGGAPDGGRLEVREPEGPAEPWRTRLPTREVGPMLLRARPSCVAHVVPSREGTVRA